MLEGRLVDVRSDSLPTNNLPQVMILAGGLGTRMREETEFRPKPMVEVGGKPVLWHLLKIFSDQGLNRFIVCTGYKGEVIKQYFKDFDSYNSDIRVTAHGTHSLGEKSNFPDSLEVIVADTGQKTNTGGRLHVARKYVDSDKVIVVYGDGLANVNVASLLQFHDRREEMATITTTMPRNRFGVVNTDTNSKVQSFSEKPLLTTPINIGFYVFPSSFLDDLSGDPVLEQDPITRLASDGQLAAFEHEGFWEPMDTYREYLFLNALWDSESKAPWLVPHTK